MSRKTNKTARVLSLITNRSATEEESLNIHEDDIPQPLNDSTEKTESEKPASSSSSKPSLTSPADTAPEIASEDDDYIKGNDLSAQRDTNPDDFETIEKEKTDDKKTDEYEAPSGQFKKLMSERLSNNNQSKKATAPIVEILFNDHDPLSDLIRDQLQAEETMTEAAQKRGNFMIDEEKNVPLAEEDSSPIPFITHDSSSGTVTIKTTDGAESDQLDYKFVNVFEEIVRGRVLEVMQNFNVCTCDRCIVDVVALTVTNLPAKCIVADKGAIFPLLSYYSSKYSTQVQTELVKACIKVKDNPHHKL